MPSPTPDRSLATILPPERVVILTSHAKEDVLEELILFLGKSAEVTDVDDLRRGIFHREEMMSTGIGLGIGVPHLRCGTVRDLVMAVGISQQAVAGYESLDGEPVHLVCMIAAGADQHSQYIQTLSLVSKKLRDRELFKSVISATDPAAAHALLTSN